MTISTTQDRITHVGNGSTTTFAFPYYFVDAAHIYCIRITIATQVNLVLVQGTDFTVSGAGVPGGGSVTTIGPLSPLTSAYQLLILRLVPLTQLSDYVANDRFPAETMERGLDLAAMALQQLDARIGILETTGPVGALTLANVGTGQGTLFRDQVGSIYNIKTLKQGTGISLTNNADDVTINNTGSAISLPGTTNQFYRGDGNFSNLLTGPLEIDGTDGSEPSYLLKHTHASISANNRAWRETAIRNGTTSYYALRPVDDSFAGGTDALTITRSGTSPVLLGLMPTTGRVLVGAATDDTTSALQVQGAARFTTALAIASGGSGQSTQQAAINALTNVAGATAGHVLTKSGSNAVFAAPSVLVFNVKDYGATGNGSTDDTSAIQSCINAAVAAGLSYGTFTAANTVYFPAGVYKTTSLLTCGTSIRLLGAGRHQAVILSTHAGGAVSITAGDTTDEVNICDLAFCANAGGGGDSGTAIAVSMPHVASSSVPSVNIRNVHIFDQYGTPYWSKGIKLTECAAYTIDTVFFKGSGTIANWAAAGIEINASCINGVLHNVVTLGCAKAVHVNATTVEGLRLSDCVFDACTYGLYNDHNGTFPPWIGLHNTHIGASTGCIRIVGSQQVHIEGCLFYLGDQGSQTTPNNSHAVHIENHNYCKIANTLIAESSAAATGTIGIYCNDGTLAHINHNQIASFATGIEIGSLIIDGYVDRNGFVSCTTDVTNNSTTTRVIRKYRKTRTVTSATYTVSQNDDVILLDATSNNITVTMRAANIAGALESPSVRMKRIDSTQNTVTITRAGSDTIDGGTSTTLGALAAKDFESDGATKWVIL